VPLSGTVTQGFHLSDICAADERITWRRCSGFKPRPTNLPVWRNSRRDDLKSRCLRASECESRDGHNARPRGLLLRKGTPSHLNTFGSWYSRRESHTGAT